jgi:hypothetical protein
VTEPIPIDWYKNALGHKFLRIKTTWDKKRRREILQRFKKKFQTLATPSLSTLTRLADGFGSKDNPTVTETDILCRFRSGFTPEIGSPALYD